MFPLPVISKKYFKAENLVEQLRSDQLQIQSKPTLNMFYPTSWI